MCALNDEFLFARSLILSLTSRHMDINIPRERMIIENKFMEWKTDKERNHKDILVPS
jgi:hypothetical protein